MRSPCRSSICMPLLKSHPKFKTALLYKSHILQTYRLYVSPDPLFGHKSDPKFKLKKFEPSKLDFAEATKVTRCLKFEKRVFRDALSIYTFHKTF